MKLGKIIKKTGEFYRKGTDWAKPTIDKVLDPMFFVLGSNTALSSMIYYTDKFAVQPIINKMVDFDKVESFFNSNSTIEALTKIGIYGTIYGLANKKIIFPTAKKIYKKKTKPSWLNHLKTWALIGGTALVLSSDSVERDVKRFKEQVKESNDFKDYVNLFTSEANLRVFDSYLSGKKSSGLLEDLVNQPIFLYKTDPEVSDKLEEGLKKIEKRNKDFSYEDQISEDSKKFINEGFIDNPEQLVYLTRVLYFENGKDGKTERKIKSGIQAEAWVMKNRYIYDISREKNGKGRGFSKKGDNLFELVFNHNKNKYGGVTWQFTCIRDHPSYFYENEGKKNWDMYENDKLNIAIGKMDEETTKWCYEVILDVLNGDLKDNTNGALFYQNYATSDKANKNWEKRYNVKKCAKINSHTFYRPKNLSKNWASKLD